MSIVTFGSRGEKSRRCPVIEVRLGLRDGRMRDLTMFVVPMICEALTCQPVTLCRDSYKHLAGPPLADPSDGTDTLDVDLLIGTIGVLLPARRSVATTVQWEYTHTLDVGSGRTHLLSWSPIHTRNSHSSH